MVETDAEGYCDPVTGACMLPGAAEAEVDETEPDTPTLDE
jgi:hypothetical protein